jgi:hypothetical protein
MINKKQNGGVVFIKMIPLGPRMGQRGCQKQQEKK